MSASDREDLRKRKREFALRLNLTQRYQKHESAYWIELIADARILEPDGLKPLQGETNELIAIFVILAKGLTQTKSADGEKVIPHPSALIP